MNKITKYIHMSILALAAFSFAACSQDEIPAWSGDDYVRIEGPSVWTLDTDSMEYSFASYPTTVTSFDVEGKVVVQGKRSDAPRTVYLKVDAAATTAEDSFYSVPESVVIPAGEGEGKFVIKIKRDAKLASKKYTLRVVIDEARSELKSGVKAYSALNIKFSDILSRPSNWSDLSEFFGESYSDVKYRFIIDVLGIGDFTYLQPGGMSWGEMWNYHLILVDALNKYAEEHHGSPLVDENGRNVSFEN